MFMLFLFHRFRKSRVSSIFFVSLLAAPLCSCSLLFPYDKSLAANPSFDDPRLTFGTLAAAAREDRPDVEYKCFSEGFKERSQIDSLQKYIHARARILHDHPQAKWVGYMRVERWDVHRDGNTAFVLASFMGRKLLVRMTRHDYAYVSFRDNTWRDFYLPSPIAETIFADGTRWTVAVESPSLRGVDLRDVVSFQLLPAWKIESFEAKERELDRPGP